MTLKTQLISVDYKTIIGEVYANAKTRVTLLTAVALDSPEIAPVMEFDFEAEADGTGVFEIIVPTSGGFSFSFRLPDFKVYTAVIGYTGVTAVPLADILADSYTPPDDAILTAYVKHDGSVPMTAELPLSGNPVADLGAAPKQYVDERLLKAAELVTAGAAYTTLAADGGADVLCPVACTFTCADGLDDGFQQTVFRTGSGVVTITADTTLVKLTADTGLETVASVTIETAVTITHIGSDIWMIVGDYS